jgi:transposase-like protein
MRSADSNEYLDLERMKIEIGQCRMGTWLAVDESGKVLGFALTQTRSEGGR